VVSIIKPPAYNQYFLYGFGLCLRVVNKVRRSIVGYTKPRTFSVGEIERSVSYCIDVVRSWEKELGVYSGRENPFAGADVLEIGPGPDLGTGLVILAMGARSYVAIDKNELIWKTPQLFYDTLLEKLKTFPRYENAKAALKVFRHNNVNDVFSYACGPDLNGLTFKKFDVLVSQAVLEHIINIESVFETLYKRIAPGGLMIHEIDFGTHTGIIRDIDPLNHLRYCSAIWNLLKFDGSPNRLQLSDYKNVFNQLGFRKIEVKVLKILDKQYVHRTKTHLSALFRDYSDEEIGIKSLYLLATK
jgi:SAM-dependent methyltransferase